MALFWLFVVALVALLFVLDFLAKRPKHIKRPSLEDTQDDKTIHPFTISISDDVLDDLRKRLSYARFPDQLQLDAAEKKKWQYGTDLDYLKELVNYWKDDFDWRKQETLLNQFDQFTTDIDGKKVHFIHVRSPEKNAKALVLIHGWPGSFFEFYKIIGPLTNPAAHGGDPNKAFHVVVPSLPGYAFSSPATKPGQDVQAMAVDLAKLMARLGYSSYFAQGGDWGSFVASYMALVDPQHCKAIHLNLVIAKPPPGLFNTIATLLQVFVFPKWAFTEDELKGLRLTQEYQKKGSGYAEIQGSKPQTLGYGLNDSPVGLLAWIVEKFHCWSDCNSNIESRFSKDVLLTNVMLYWVTGSITSSTRLYYETKHSGRWDPPDGFVTVPTACALFPVELFQAPKKWVMKQYNVKRWTVFRSGGHFAALEESQALTDDIREFFYSL